jgi:hypothetical protein
MSARDRIHAMLPILDSPVDADTRASQMDVRLDAYRAEVLAEADLLPKADVVAWLVKKAREDTPVWLLASKVERGAVRPDNLRMLPPDFFEPGHSYTHRDGHDFKCVAVTAHPQTGERLAMGWRVDSWDLHYPATCGINQWNHEYDGVAAPAEGEQAGEVQS